MKTRVSKALLFTVPFLVGGLLGVDILTAQAEPAKKIEIVLKDSTSKVISGYTLTELPTEIIVRNEDSIAHGFNSSLFGKNDKAEIVTGGTAADGKGPNVFRVEPGKTMVIKFTKPAQEGVETRTYSFWCDMHRGMKGEMLVVEFNGPGGA